MAGLRARLSWRTATLVEVRDETPTARTLVLDIPDWPGHLAGQHVDVRLTAPDGYSTQRSYSIASAADGAHVELTVQRVLDGEVSSYLIEEVAIGDEIELRGPVGGWFVWRTDDTTPTLLLAGGSGVVPLMAMIRARRAAANRALFRLVYSARAAEDVIYAGELLRPVGPDAGVDVQLVHTRAAPPSSPRPAGRMTPAELAQWAWPTDFEPHNYVCGPTAFVETVANQLVALGHDSAQIRTERFG